MKKQPPPCPGQVYWNQKLGFSAVVYSVRPGAIRCVVLKPAGFGRRTKYSILWRSGVPDYYTLQYSPPKRRDECN